MRPQLLRKLVVGAVVVGALAGGGAALATVTTQNGGGGHGGAFAGVRGGGHGPGHRHGIGEELQAAADYLGVTTTQLVTDLRAGKTLAAIAGATQGKSAAGLISALVAHEKAELAEYVAAGRLTQARADAIAATLAERVTAFVNGTRPARGDKPGGKHGKPRTTTTTTTTATTATTTPEPLVALSRAPPSPVTGSASFMARVHPSHERRT